MEIIEQTIRFVKEQLKNAEGGHDNAVDDRRRDHIQNAYGVAD